MRKVILIVAILLGVHSGIQAQEVSEKTLIGKWKLEFIDAQGQKVETSLAFGTDQVYQVYKAKGEFVSLFGDETDKGNWKFSDDKKTIVISVEGSPDTLFKLVSFKGKTMSLEFTDEGETLVLNYKKVEK